MDRNRIINKLAKSKIKADGQRTEYQLTKELGRGGNGVAFIAKSTKRELVAKFYIPPDGRDLDESALKRFYQEMELTAKVNHPYVLASAGFGRTNIGAYQIPFYLMPRAAKTLRDLVPRSFSTGNLGGLRRFTRVAQGVCYLHHLGIFHRDLKPENILLFNDVPKVSDLGIAHVSPGFVDVSLHTVPKEQLMNRDYYAPEQRHGDATKVDGKADIYALGCILYELISAISPTRPNLPPLADLDIRLAALDTLFNKMTAHDPQKRYQQLDEAIDDLTWALIKMGDIAATAATSAEADEELLRKFLHSTNGLHQEQAIEPAIRLGERALPFLHDAVGHRRVDVVAGAYRILGELAHESSIPFLRAGLYPRRTSSKPHFPSGGPAAKAIQKFAPQVRLTILGSLSDLVRAEDIEIILNGVDSREAYDQVLSLYQKGRFFSDWGINPGLTLMLKIDANKTWPHVEDLMRRDHDFYATAALEKIYPYVDMQRKQQLIDHFLTHPASLWSWSLRNLASLIADGDFPESYVPGALDRLGSAAHVVIKRYEERSEFDKHLRTVKSRWHSERGAATGKVPVSSPANRTGSVSDAGSSKN